MAIVAVVLFGSRTALSYFVEALWFRSLGYGEVFAKSLGLQWGIFFGFAAITFFGGDTLWARGWMSGLQSSPDGLMPRFDVDVMVASLDEVAKTSYWKDWSNVWAPALIVRAENGVPRDAVLRMIETQPRAQLAEIAKAKHDVHLDKPIEWRRTVDAFLRAQPY